MIVLGADTHKRTHALAAVDAIGGVVVGQRSITADQPGHLQALRWARELDEERVWAIEDCRPVSRRLELALVAAGERVVRVAPQLMGQSRQGERQPGKSDQIDALAVARASALGNEMTAVLGEQANLHRALVQKRRREPFDAFAHHGWR